jgi:hypothetical protein
MIGTTKYTDARSAVTRQETIQQGNEVNIRSESSQQEREGETWKKGIMEESTHGAAAR